MAVVIDQSDKHIYFNRLNEKVKQNYEDVKALVGERVVLGGIILSLSTYGSVLPPSSLAILSENAYILFQSVMSFLARGTSGVSIGRIARVLRIPLSVLLEEPEYEIFKPFICANFDFLPGTDPLDMLYYISRSVTTIVQPWHALVYRDLCCHSHYLGTSDLSLVHISGCSRNHRGGFGTKCRIV